MILKQASYKFLMKWRISFSLEKLLMKKRIVLTVGCRPDCIKIMPLVKELKKRKDIETVLLSTGQHRQMLDQVFEAFDEYPDYDLEIMKPGQSLFDITTNILNKIQAAMAEIKPDVVLVHGDTSTAFVTALACFYLQIPVGHVEAGLRTYNIYSPYPEEFNRQGIGLIAKYNFAPTKLAKQNLLNEGKKPESIYVTGNTVIDALHWVVNKLRSDAALASKQVQALAEAGYDVNRLKKGRKLVLITGHRRENFGEGLDRKSVV